MGSETYTRRLEHRTMAAGILAAVTVGVGATIIVGWLFGIEAMKSLVPGLVPVKMNTAVCLVLSGLSLFFRAWFPVPDEPAHPGDRLALQCIARVCSGVVVVVAALTLCEYVFRIDLGIDQFLVTETPDAPDTLCAGRMAIPAALNFVLVGLALLSRRNKRGWVRTKVMAGGAAVLALLAFVGETYGVVSLASYGHYTPMSVLTSFAFLLLCTGILISDSTRQGHEVAEARDTMWLTGLLVALCLTLLGGSVVTSMRQASQFQETIAPSFTFVSSLKVTQSSLEHVETATRAYLMTADSTFLESVEREKALLQSQLPCLRARALERASLRTTLTQIEAWTDQEIAWIDKVVTVGRSGAFADAKDLMEKRQEGPALTEITRMLNTMDQNEIDYRYQIQSAAHASSLRAIAAFSIGGLVMAIFLILFFSQMTHEIAEHGHSVLERERIFKLSPDLLCTMGMDGYFRELSPSFQDILGWSDRELREKPFMSIVLPEDQGRTHAAMSQLRDQEPVLDFVNRYVCKDGSVRWISWSTLPLLREGVIYSVGRDVTDRVMNEEVLRDTNKRLQAALGGLKQAQAEMVKQERMNALSLMVSGIAHDFNNVLMPMVGLPEFLLAHPDALEDKAGVAEALEDIRTAALDARDIVRRLREFYRPQEGVTVEPVDVADLITGVIRLTEPEWKIQAEAEGRMITIQTQFASMPPIQANPGALRELLTNLIINASHAIEHVGSITIQTAPDAEWFVLTVSDTGVGMSEEVKDRCFEPFFSTKGDKGTGLGLSVCYGIARRHDGTISVESQPGVGTTFTVRLPVKGPTGVQSGADSPARLAGASVSSLRILAVDDSPVSRNLVRTYLQAGGHSVELAESGEKGIERLKRGGIDLIVTDRAMPGMSGDEFAAKAGTLAPGTPVIMLTGFGDFMNYRSELPKGVDVILPKPVTPDELNAAICTAMAAAKRR